MPHSDEKANACSLGVGGREGQTVSVAHQCDSLTTHEKPGDDATEKSLDNLMKNEREWFVRDEVKDVLLSRVGAACVAAPNHNNNAP